jgi:phospholipase C
VTPQGDIRDIKHVVILMQENRSFDHYFGSLRGVRGFASPVTWRPARPA